MKTASIQVVMAFKFLLILSIASLLIAQVVADDNAVLEAALAGDDENLVDNAQSRDLAIDIEGPEEVALPRDLEFDFEVRMTRPSHLTWHSTSTNP